MRVLSTLSDNSEDDSALRRYRNVTCKVHSNKKSIKSMLDRKYTKYEILTEK